MSTPPRDMIDPHHAPPPAARLPGPRGRRAFGLVVLAAWLGLLALAALREQQDRADVAAALRSPPPEAPPALPPPALGATPVLARDAPPAAPPPSGDAPAPRTPPPAPR